MLVALLPRPHGSAESATTSKRRTLHLVHMLLALLAAICLLSDLSVAETIPPTCALDSNDNGKDPYSSIARTDVQIAAALKQALSKDPGLDIDSRGEIIMQGVFGPCFMVTVRDVQFEIGWLNRPLASYDRARDTQLAADGMQRVVRLFRAHKIPLEDRVANVIIQRVSSGDTRYLTVHWPAGVLRRALSTPKDAEHILRNGYLVHDGDSAPQHWVRPDLARR